MQISDFTIGLGLDSGAFEKGMKSAVGTLGGFKSQVLQIGATLASAFTMKTLTFDFAEQNNALAAMSNLIGTTKDQLYGLDEAGQAFGASAGAMTETLKSLARARADFNNLGEIGFFGELAKLGVNIDGITGARSEMEAMYALADELSQLDGKRAAQAAAILGLSPEQLALMRNGREEMQRLSAEYAAARKHTDEMSSTSADFLAQWNLLTANIGGRADALSTPLVEALTEVTKATNEWFSANRDVIDQNIGAVFTGIAGAADEAGKVFSAFLETLEPVGDRIAQIGKVTSDMINGLGELFSAVGEKVDEWTKPITSFFGDGAAAIQDKVDAARESNGGLLNGIEIGAEDGNAIRTDVVTPNYYDPTLGTEALGYAAPTAALPAGFATGSSGSGQAPVIEAHIHIGNETVKETVRAEVKGQLREAIDSTYGTVDR